MAPAPGSPPGGERVDSRPLSGTCFRRVEKGVGPGKQAVSFDLFYDETVIESSGKRYKPCAAPSRR